MIGPDEQLEAELAELRERKAKIAAQREARETADAKRAELEALRREVEDAEAIAGAEEKHGADKIATVRTPLGVVIVRRPNHMHFRRFVNLKEPTSDDAEKLVLSCLVHPTRATFEQIAEEYPAIPMDAAMVVLDLARGRAKDISGKS